MRFAFRNTPTSSSSSPYVSRFGGSGYGLVLLSGIRVQGLGFRVQGLWFKVEALGFRVQGSGFRVQGSWFSV